MQIIVNGIVTHYNLVNNKGKTILLIHGWGDNSEGLNLIFNHLKNNYQVVSLDLPGFGKSGFPNDSWDNLDYANFVKAFLDKLDLKIDVVIGHSNGGAIAIELLAHQFIKPKKTILLASAGIRNQSSYQKKATRYLAHVLKFLAYILPKNLRYKVKKKVYSKIGSDMFVQEKLVETFRKVIAQDVLEDAKKIRDVDVLLIYGQDDRATPITMGQLFHDNIHKSRLVIIKNCGHFIQLDQPQKLLKLIDEFI